VVLEAAWREGGYVSDRLWGHGVADGLEAALKEVGLLELAAKRRRGRKDDAQSGRADFKFWKSELPQLPVDVADGFSANRFERQFK